MVVLGWVAEKDELVEGVREEKAEDKEAREGDDEAVELAEDREVREGDDEAVMSAWEAIEAGE